ncbi:unnamed protein product [Heterobilharzia americana]|nr:unnamed protein product [Heterobilharzia americana]
MFLNQVRFHRNWDLKYAAYESNRTVMILQLSHKYSSLNISLVNMNEVVVNSTINNDEHSNLFTGIDVKLLTTRCSDTKFNSGTEKQDYKFTELGYQNLSDEQITKPFS